MPADNSKTITRNSLWYMLDSSATTVVMLIASVPVARIMGPKILGHYVYLLFLTGIAQRLANLGIPATACKYMAEFLGCNEHGIAHEVFRVTLRYQVAISGVITSIGLLLTGFSEAGYRTIAIIIVASMWPAMISYIPAQANVAAENLGANIPGTLASLCTYTGLVICSLAFNWGLLGLATATLVSRCAEVGVRYWSVQRWIGSYPRQPIPPHLRQRMLRFSRQNLVLMALGLVVWDRSEVIFLKYFCDVRQVAFYSLAFSITNQLLMVPRGVSASIGITILAQYGRDPKQLAMLAKNATRYVSLLTIPVFIGTAAVAEPLIRMTYGTGYLSVVPVLWIMCALCIPRAFQIHTENMLQATEKQGFMVKWLVFTACLNLSLDAVLIPSHGALGAATANGLAQSMGLAGLLYRSGGFRDMISQKRYLSRLLWSAGLMCTVVLALIRVLPFWASLPAGIAVGTGVFFAGLRIFRVLEAEDCRRLNELIARFPKHMQRLSASLLSLCVIPEPTSRRFVAVRTGVRE